MAAAGVRWPPTYIISGFRTAETQAEVNPTVEHSCHTVEKSGEPSALAADLTLGVMDPGEYDVLLAILGGIWKMKLRGRWGGDFTWEGSPKPNPDEQNHFDLGPCL